MRKIFSVHFIVLMMICLLYGCGFPSQEMKIAQPTTVDYNELQFSDRMPLEYAKQFTVAYCEQGYKLLTVGDQQRFLVVAENAIVPNNTDKDIVILQQPLEHIYMVSTSSMDYFCALDLLDCITLCSQTEDKWYLPKVKEAMQNGTMQYAGKYSAPDYEKILASDCDLAIENTMIYHTPKVKEQLERVGIPVLVDYSGYESEPLGRMEWIKLYGALLNREDLAEEIYTTCMNQVKPILQQEKTGKTIAFFSVTSTGAITVRKSGDYITHAIEEAGGVPICFEAEEENAMSTMNVQPEFFYAIAKDADILIYNSTIDGELQTMEQLLQKNPIFSEFQAIKNNSVWCLGKNLYQQPMDLGYLILDLHHVMQEKESDELQFLHPIQ